MGTPDQDDQRSTTSEGASGAAEGHAEQQEDMPTAGSASAAATQEEQEQGEGDRSDEQEGAETTESKADSQTAVGSPQQSKSQVSGGGGQATEGSNCDASGLASTLSTEAGGKHRSGGTCSVASTATAEAAVATAAGTSSTLESSSNRHVAASRNDESSSTSRHEIGTSSNSAVFAKSDMEETTNAFAPPQEQSQQEQTQQETVGTGAAAAGSSSRSDVDGTSSSGRNAPSSSPIEVMADQSGFNINLSSLPPGAYMVEPANPPVRRESYSNGIAAEGGDVLTAEVREADAGEVGAEEQSVAAASRSSISTITNPNFGGTSRSSVGWTAGTDALTGAENTDDALHHVVTATCVDEECVVDACPVPDEDEIILVQAEHEEQKHQIARLRKRQRFLLGGAIVALVAIAIAVGVAFGGEGNNGAGDGLGTTGTAIDADRIEALRSIILPLSGEGAFDPTSLDFSEQRVSALTWLANDRYTTEQLPVDDPSLTWKIRQRYVMGLFHIMTNSTNWFDNFNGLSARDECDWNRASSLDGKEAEDLFTGIQKEVEIKGIICNEMGQVKRIILCKSTIGQNFLSARGRV